MSSSLVYLVYWFISPLTLLLDSGTVSGLLFYFTMGNFAGEWDNVRFIGLLVYSTIHTSSGGWDCVRFIG